MLRRRLRSRRFDHAATVLSARGAFTIDVFVTGMLAAPRLSKVALDPGQPPGIRAHSGGRMFSPAAVPRSISYFFLSALFIYQAAGVTVQAGHSTETLSPTARADQNTRAAYATLPLSFVPNQGQLDARVRYVAQTGGSGFYFTQREAVFKFPSKSGGARATAGICRRQSRRRNREPGGEDGDSQLPDRQRSRALAHQPAHVRRDCLSRPLARYRSGVSRRERPAQVRIPARARGGSGKHSTCV